jgi:hypothetical protein
MSLNWQNLEIEQLHSVCLIDQEMARNPSAVVQFQLPSCPESVRIIRVPNVLYDPRLRLQVLPSGGVPTEGIMSGSLILCAAGFLKIISER